MVNQDNPTTIQKQIQNQARVHSSLYTMEFSTLHNPKIILMKVKNTPHMIVN